MDKKNHENTKSRRDFVKTSLVGVGSLALGNMISAKEASAAKAPTRWDAEADVVVLGFGGAGACAAIEAAKAGARVLILEKQPQKSHYSNTRMSGGIFHSPDPSGDKAALKAYAEAMFSGNNIPWKLEGEQDQKLAEGLAEAFAAYVPDNAPFLKRIDPTYQTVSFGGFKGAAFPNFPGAKDAKYKVYGSTYTGKADFNAKTKDLPKSQKMNGEAFFQVLLEGVKKSGAKIMYETAGRELLRDHSGQIIGVKAERAGKTFNCKARRSVVVTTGGYEYNLRMRRAFLEGPGVEGWGFYGSPANTGDGIEMVAKIGGALDKVGKAASRMIAVLPVRHHGLKMGMITPAVGKPNSIVVDSFGRRYAAEHLITKDPSRYLFYKEAVHLDILKLVYPRVPSWLIFDENLRSKRCLTYQGISTPGYDYISWSKDNMDAVKRGWIMQADSLEKLADRIKAHPENRKLFESANLVDAVKDYNAGCESGKDRFKRLKRTLGPVAKPPFYAIAIYPGGPNTKGGIACNASREVVDWDGKPIPRLFTAGEISSAFKFVYQGGGNLSECITFGRIAGKNAAAVKPWC
ncbi:FAD-dependent oxidoreductase [Dethiosulfatarculus sandiegensis]|uniref:Fumarate reductase n=1 Tax=Dethiosulfatarculus sandiegensis TaxID=1429043 RepID=A0A0D2JF41_9BACT|nr:FAD-dependent oxidoreductase [Dethiosulfatarculus sandiegensis]KIX14311.1 fumarate reductase [Dethiosulfatarculus sandiegensis]